MASIGPPLLEFLHQECGLCSLCASLVAPDSDQAAAIADEQERDVSYGSDAGVSGNCTVCFGVSSPSYQSDCILPMITESLLPYCQARRPGTDAADEDASGGRPLIDAEEGNHLMRESPTVNLPWIIAVRAHCAIAAAERYMSIKLDASAKLEVHLRTAEEVYLGIKERLRSSLRAMMETLTKPSGGAKTASQTDKVILPRELQKEEGGYLGVHVLLLPPLGGSMENLLPPSLWAQVRPQKRQLQQAHKRILNPRKRFRGNDPTLKQGGDPRSNLEFRARRRMDRASANESSGQSDGNDPQSELRQWNEIVCWLEKNVALEWIAKESSATGANNAQCELAEWLRQLRQNGVSSSSCCIHAAAWRRPFYIQGTYTKSRRDVSQTPFYVPATTNKSLKTDDGNEGEGKNNLRPDMVRKGVSSVEDEICPPLALTGCGGISTLNNEQTGKSEVGGGKGATVYGLCKFHASGREDMDVRMLLPPPSVAAAGAKSGISITGRPFVCEAFDAHRIPSEKDLESVVDAINCRSENTVATATSSCGESNAKEIELDEKGWPQTLVQPHRYHGSNPRGVGISRPLRLVPSGAFSGLQAETEEKVKHYGCVCWTSVPIASDEALVQKLGCLPWNQEAKAASNARSSGIYPLEIHQSTPLRVLHRRSSDVRTRHILSLSAHRISENWFRLRMSTSAGTYVKEFVHGDCGRTYPSVGSMLGGRTDITELDCEGIAL